MTNNRKTLTKKNIEAMAYAIMEQLIKHHADEDVKIYFNDCSIRTDKGGEGTRIATKIKDEKPHDYFEYAAYDHILSMSFEGRLYDIIDSNGIPSYIQKIFDKYGVCSELGNMWNLTCYPQDDTMKIEYTKYEKPKEITHLCLGHWKGEDEIFQSVMQLWREFSKKIGDVGSCVINAGFSFNYNNKPYFMSPASCYQGSISWETNKDEIETILKVLGCTNIKYNWGRMD